MAYGTDGTGESFDGPTWIGGQSFYTPPIRFIPPALFDCSEPFSGMFCLLVSHVPITSRRDAKRII
jgi:hypothetical protein